MECEYLDGFNYATMKLVLKNLLTPWQRLIMTYLSFTQKILQIHQVLDGLIFLTPWRAEKFLLKAGKICRLAIKCKPCLQSNQVVEIPHFIKVIKLSSLQPSKFFHLV